LRVIIFGHEQIRKHIRVPEGFGFDLPLINHPSACAT
jgi:hypothetical protein